MCLFCQIVKKEIPSSFLYEDADIIAINDINPKAPVHILIISKKHIASIAKLKEDDQELVGKIICRAKLLAEEKGIAESGYKLVFNCGVDGGQIIPHIHLHLLGGKQLDSVA